MTETPFERWPTAPTIPYLMRRTGMKKRQLVKALLGARDGGVTIHVGKRGRRTSKRFVWLADLDAKLPELIESVVVREHLERLMRSPQALQRALDQLKRMMGGDDGE